LLISLSLLSNGSTFHKILLALEEFGFDVMNVKEVTARCPSPEV
jgi:hypothetical protein